VGWEDVARDERREANKAIAGVAGNGHISTTLANGRCYPEYTTAVVERFAD
jgi:hypothetical protein